MFAFNDPAIQARADELFAAGAEARALQAASLNRHHTGVRHAHEVAKAIGYLEAYDRIFARQKAEREARAWEANQQAFAAVRRAA